MTWPGFGSGAGRSSIASTSGPPYRLITIARMAYLHHLGEAPECILPYRQKECSFDQLHRIFLYDPGPHDPSAAVLRRGGHRGQLSSCRRKAAAVAADGLR